MESRSRGSNQDDPTLLSGSSASEEQTFLTDSNEATYLSPMSQPVSAAGDGPRLKDGQPFGPYEIIRLLGRGGMGEVYEARQLETGRRVALKVLRSRFGLREDRERFLREGQLAASISHPHTVYIFGSEEIDRMPVISMQLLPGGTLKDRVVERGPMSPTEAVAAVLDVIGGLDAAASAGILHRDIKPSNCFVDVDGSVKVGDFGLSISTSAREATQGTKGFQGTPQFAPPEQLRGEALDVRADIYAVGATLFYLLTGKPPFESRDINDLFESVKNAPAMAPQQLQPKIPSALGAVVLRCLAKEPAKRPASYAELVRELRPFSGTTTPARRGLRLVAGVIDACLAAVPMLIINSLSPASIKIAGRNSGVDVNPWSLVIAVLYFAVSEGRWGTTIGKRICGLRVVSTSGELSWKQALARSLIFYAPGMPVVIAALIWGQVAVLKYMSSNPGIASLASTGQVVCSALMFITMRRKNGLAAIHDLITHTRVVIRRPVELRRAAIDTSTSADSAGALSPAASRRRYGSFDVGAELATIPGGRLLEGFDTTLKRRVWIVECAAGTPAVASSRRDIDRVGRPHWLAGRRSAGDQPENWDAFEAPQGVPLDPTPGSAPWSSAKGWLTDLTSELAAAEREGSTPFLAIDRVWIRTDGRAVLLDFPAPGTTSTSTAASSSMTALELLARVGQTTLGHRETTPMPVSAVAMIDRWKRGSTKSLAAAAEDLVAVSVSPDRVSRSRRLTSLALNAFPVVVMIVAALIAMSKVGKVLNRDYFTVLRLLTAHDKEKDPVMQHAIETYLAANFHEQLRDDSVWRETRDSKTESGAALRVRAAAERIATLRPDAAEVAAAIPLVQARLDEISKSYDSELGDKNKTGPATIAVALLFVGGGFSFFSALISVLIRPSGLTMSMLGLAVLTRKGREISRLGAVARLVVAWSPLIVYGGLLCVPQLRTPLRTGALGMSMAVVVSALLLAGMVWTILRPTRGPHDAAMGTVIGVR